MKGNNQESAFGHPGIEPRWTRSGKDGVGTAYSASSRVWVAFLPERSERAARSASFHLLLAKRRSVGRKGFSSRHYL